MPDFSSAEGMSPEDLPELSKKDTLKRYRGRLEAAREWRDSEGFTETWKRLRDIYRLKMYDAFAKEDRIAVAVSFATVNVIAPSVAVNHPKVVVLARQEPDRQQAITAEAVVNYWWRHYDVKPEFRAAVKDFLVYGHGWVKVGWRYKDTERELETEQQSLEVETLANEADEYAAQNPALAGDLPTDDQIREQAPRSETVVIEDRPFVERVSPYDILLDPEAVNGRELQWIAQKVVRPVEEVKHDPRYKRSVRRKVESDGALKWQNEDSTYHVKEDCERITIWEYYDLQRNQMCVFTEAADGFLVDPVPLPYTYGHPFVMIRNYEVPDQFYPLGDLEALEPLQGELNETRTAMVRQRKLDIRKHLIRTKGFGPEGLDAIRSDEDNAVIPVVDDNTPFQDLIAPLPRNDAVSPMLFQHSEQIESDIDLVSGVSEYMRGSLPEIRRTATEASMIQDAANARAADKLDIIESAIGDVARRLVQLAQAYLTGPQVVRLVDPDAASSWVAYSRDEIQGEFDFSVEAGSTQPQNETFRRQQAMQLAQAMAPYVGVVVDPQALVTHVLREGFGVKNPERFLLQMPMMSPPGAPTPEGETEGQKPPPDVYGGTDAIAPAQVAQLQGQTGFNPQTLGVGNGGGAEGPGSAKAA